MKGLAALFALIACPAAAGTLLAGPSIPGPDALPTGQTVLEQVFPDGVPEPFTALLDQLREVAGARNVQTALIPLGRSLQRFSAHPDYFTSPRIVVAITGDQAAGPGTPRLADRLFIAYQPAADAIEALSYSEERGRFEFFEIAGYGTGRNVIEAAERQVCIECHQGHGPIFPRPLWSETNANPMIAKLMAGLGESFQGVPVRQSVDALQEFDASTDRAARIALANRLWDEGCENAPCRATLLSAALRYGLNGARPSRVAPTGLAGAFSRRTAELWPDGLSIPDFDLPNRDPARLLASLAPDQIIETEGIMNPETPRAPISLWKPSARAFEDAAGEIAAFLSPGDLAWIDRLLDQAEISGTETYQFDCSTTTIPHPVKGSETRFNCTGSGGSVRGYFTTAEQGYEGRIDLLRIAGIPGLSRLRLAADEDVATRSFTLTQPGTGMAARLGDGRRISQFLIDPQARRAEVKIIDDFTPLAGALEQQARAGDPAFDPGPFRRRLVLSAVMRILEGPNG